MATVGFIGSGMIGGTVARLALAAGHAVVLSIGYGVVDAGPLAESWRQQPGEPVYGAPYRPYEDPRGRPASEGTIRAALAAATR